MRAYHRPNWTTPPDLSSVIIAASVTPAAPVDYLFIGDTTRGLVAQPITLTPSQYSFARDRIPYERYAALVPENCVDVSKVTMKTFMPEHIIDNITQKNMCNVPFFSRGQYC